ncbi:MAG: hypothetical protein ACE5KM_13515 [Planctomycetaceae bacterium]
MRRFLLTSSLFGALLMGGLSASAVACPMCKQANESAQTAEENARPKAYMYSILFMLAMPATILTGFGIGFYRLSKKNGDAVDGPDAMPPTAPPGE